ncbi:MAG: MmcQ/YjbR family DNA-binding protein [Aeromicrobium sp.]
MAVTWAEVEAMATELPEVEISTSYGTPALKVAGKLMGRLRTDSDGSLALKTSDKDALVASDDPAYFTTPHYDGYNYILVNLDLADAPELAELIDDAWRLAAPTKVRKQRES